PLSIHLFRRIDHCYCYDAKGKIRRRYCASRLATCSSSRWFIKSFRTHQNGWHRHYQSKNDSRCRSLCRSEEHTSELQSRFDLVCRLLLEKKNIKTKVQ